MNPRYGKPPITEAILDLRVEPQAGLSTVDLAVGLKPLAEAFPLRRELPAAEALSPTGFVLPPELTNGVVLGGFRYESADSQRVFQARRDGFVFSFVGTAESRYAGWDTFAAEARGLWEHYVQAARPAHITRIALRYVNRFDVESEDVPMAERLALLPQFPRDEFLNTKAVSDFRFRLVLPEVPTDNDTTATAILQHALKYSDQGEPYLILDIDVFQEQLRLKPEQEADLWQRLEGLRGVKNRLFQASLTEAAEAALQPLPPSTPGEQSHDRN